MLAAAPQCVSASAEIRPNEVAGHVQFGSQPLEQLPLFRDICRTLRELCAELTDTIETFDHAHHVYLHKLPNEILGIER